MVLADEDGAIVVPRSVVRPVLAEAERLTRTEVEIRRELKAGLTLDQALTKFGHV
jgi:regulator of RNase E activity RraA